MAPDVLNPDAVEYQVRHGNGFNYPATKSLRAAMCGLQMEVIVDDR